MTPPYHAGYVSTQFLDPTFNGVDWQAVLNPALAETFTAPNVDAARTVAAKLLAKLGDYLCDCLLCTWFVCTIILLSLG